MNTLDEASRLLELGKLVEAEDVCRQLIAQDPELAVAHFKLGKALSRQKRGTDAEDAYRAGLKLQRFDAEASLELALLLLDDPTATPEARFDAEGLLKTALSERPDYYEAHLRLGNLLQNSGRMTEARYHYLRTVALRPDSAVAHQRLGETYRSSDRLMDAVAELQHAVELNPRLASAWSSLGSCYLSLSQVDTALSHFRRAVAEEPGALSALKNTGLALNYIAAEKADAYSAHLEIAAAIRKQEWFKDFRRVAYPPAIPDKRLRVGFVTGDFRRHSVSYFMLNLLRELDHRNFEYHTFFTARFEDERSLDFRTLIHFWHRVEGLDNPQLAKLIGERRIDILIDLSGYTMHSRTEVFSLSPAPVQMAWIGYPNTSGMKEIQYRITDSWADPPGDDDAFHAETLVRMPRSFLCYSPPPDAPEVSEAPCNESGFVTFGSFNLRTKISDQCIALWARVLNMVPGSRLILKSLLGFGDQPLRAALLDRFGEHGVDSSRIDLMTSEISTESHLERYADMDIGLDTFPYCGTTTTCEALWMGVPVVTMTGDRHVSRVGTSLLNNAGLPELIAANEDAFVRIAVALANDVKRINALRQGMRDKLKASPLLDAKAMARGIEFVWRNAWQKYCEENPLAEDAESIGSANDLLRLHLGAAEPREGWTVVDVEGTDSAETSTNLNDLSAFGDGSCAEIYCANLLQRLPTAEVLDALQEMHRVLQPGGKLYLAVPDLDTLAEMFASRQLGRAKKFQVMRRMFGMQAHELDFNKTGLGFDFLSDCLQDVGFSGAEHVESFGLFDDDSESRIEGVLVSLNLIVEK